MSWASKGWDEVDSYESSSSDKKYGTRRFWMPAEKMKRILFLDGDPFCFYEHGLWALTKNSYDKAICLTKNGLGDSCPLCEAELWPSFIGYFSVIDMGDVIQDNGGVRLEGWTSDKGVTYQFDRKLYGAKRGGKDKPGVLKKLQRLALKHGGDLSGTVWDVYRSGKKVESVGDEFEFVTKLGSAEEIVEFLQGFGAEREKLVLTPVDYSEEFVPTGIDELRRLVGQKAGGDGFDDYAAGVAEEEIPF